MKKEERLHERKLIGDEAVGGGGNGKEGLLKGKAPGKENSGETHRGRNHSCFGCGGQQGQRRKKKKKIGHRKSPPACSPGILGTGARAREGNWCGFQTIWVVEKPRPPKVQGKQTCLCENNACKNQGKAVKLTKSAR